MQFSDFNLSNPLLDALAAMGLHQPTTIQEKAFSVIMSGKDVCGIAQTGTGKTLAYLLPIIRILEFAKSRFPQVLILVPTRELVNQVVAMGAALCAIRNFTIVGVYGGVNMKPQADALLNGCDIVVGTPGRVYDLILQGAFVPKNIKKLVIDEMDEMLNLGFRSQLKNIIETLPEKRQNLLFSATLPKEIEDLLDEYFSHPVRVEAAPAGTPVANITQLAFDVPNFNTKVNLLNYLLANDESIQKALVFTESKKFADKLLQSLDPALQEVAGVIHSNKEQNHRFQTVAKLKDGTYRFIIATDIVARGIDIAQVDHVINFDIPENPENYIHRIGRTGRANEKGIALSFVTPKDYEKVKDIEQLMQQDLDIHPLPATVITDPTLIKEEMPIVVHKEIQLKIKPKENVGPAFHEKKAKNNRQVQKKQSHKEKMMEKYGKSKTRGAKGKKR